MSGCIIHEGVFQAHIAFNAVDRPFIRGLPHCTAGIYMIAAISGQPNIIRELARIHLVRELIIITVNNRCIASLSNHLAEGVYHIRQFLNGKLQYILRFDIYRDRICNLILPGLFHSKSCCCPGLLHRLCLQVNIR